MLNRWVLSGVPVPLPSEVTTLTFGGASYSEQHGSLVGLDGELIELRPQSLAVFRCLAATPDALVTKEHILQTVWGQIAVTDDSLVQCISEIRKSLGDTERCILRTLPRRGYLLVTDSTPAIVATSAMQDRGAPSRRTFVVRRWLFLSLLIIFAVAGYRMGSVGKVDSPMAGSSSGVEKPIDHKPTLSLVHISTTTDEQPGPEVQTLVAEIRVALSRYRTMRLVDDSNADYRLKLDTQEHIKSPSRVFFELEHVSEGSVLLARGHDLVPSKQPMQDLGVRIAAAVASPGVGAISEHLLASSRLKPVDEVSRAECYANGFGCVKCSGEEDNVTKRAEACLAHLLQQDPTDARAWALQATIHAHQYLWANTLPEPLRSTPALRGHYRQLAVDAANKAEALSDGKDSAVYWGMAEAYFASCQPDKLEVAVERGLAINPDDPNLLAAFGNWLSYSGKWDEGSVFTRRALEIEPTNYRHWWWMGLAKTHYVKREFAEAYAMFLKAFDERNWLSHMQLAYTLPHLGRMPEARLAVQRLRDLNPGITLESALEVYRTMCFPDGFLMDMKDALIKAGLDSRGSSEDFDNLVLPRPELVSVDGHDVEYLDVGEGEPVVFVHGAVSDYRTWGFYMLPVSESHRFISYSRRYFGTQDWPDTGEHYSNVTFARELTELIERLELGAVHVVTWSNGVTPALIAMAERPDLFKSAIHYEPVEDDIFESDSSVAELQSVWYARWQGFGDALSAGDVEQAGALLIENVFELPPGGYHNERELHQEVVRQNSRTLPLSENRSPEDPLISCEWLKRISVPTLIVGGADTFEYWQRMSQRFSECITGARFKTIEGTKHDGAIDKVDKLSSILLDFVDAQSPVVY